MWRRFSSNSVHKVDQKGRVSVPALFRKTLETLDAGGMVILVPGFRHPKAIEGYAPAGFEEIAAKISRMHPASKERKVLEWRFTGQAQPMQVDDTGRIVLSPQLKAAASIGKDALFVGSGDSFQIWNPDEHARAIGALEAEAGPEDALEMLPWGDET
jgi:MraZ protein